MYIALLFTLLAASVMLVLRGGRNRRKPLIVAGAALLLVTVGFFAFMSFWSELLWFEEVGYTRRFWTRVIATVLIAAASGAIAAGLVWVLTLPLRDKPKSARRIGVFGAAIIGILWGVLGFDVVLQWIYGVRTALRDPIFGMNIGFYLFGLPFHDALFWLALVGPIIALFVTLAVSVAEKNPHEPPEKLSYVSPIHRVSISSAPVVPHRAWFLPIAALLMTLGYNRLLAPFHLLYSEVGVVHGAGWTDIHVRLPINYLLAGLLFVAGVVLMVPQTRRALINRVAARYGSTDESLVAAVAGIPMAIIAAVWVIGRVILPALMQWLVVEPNEIARERLYIEHNIAFTREGFNLSGIEIQEFPVEAQLTPEVVQNNQALLSEVRLWDPQAFNDVVQQFQELRLYYEVTGVDYDRYDVGGRYRQVMIAPREMQATNLPAESQTFINKYFKYTHGYGLVMAPVSDFTASGLPEYIIRDLPPVTTFPSLRIQRPEIYYGELTSDYVVANSHAPEFDYPQGGSNVYTHYEGTGGIPLQGSWRKFMFGWKVGGTRLLFSEYPRPESRIMYRRNIRDRIDAVAPFLKLDYDPYAVLVDGQIHWIVDAYTTSSRYPYSEPLSAQFATMNDRATSRSLAPLHLTRGLEGMNYIRNSVKAVVNAYDGKVTLYIFDPTDPIVQVWSHIYPDLFQPMEAMPDGLLKHVRYPESMLATQGIVFRKYHMTDPLVFYNQEDLWIHATEKYYDQIRTVEPYYVMWQAPGSRDLEFILMQPFTPKNRQVLIGWIAGRCDGENYGKMVAYRFPKDKWVLGPQQVDTKIDQSPTLSAQLTLWDQHGKRVIRGNVLAIPIDEMLLYVEPIYIQAQTAAYPELRIVVVMREEEMSYAPTFTQALEGLVRGTPETTLGALGAPTSTQTAIEANRAFEEYLRLMQTGEFGEAGKQLEILRDALRRLSEVAPVPTP